MISESQDDQRIRRGSLASRWSAEHNSFLGDTAMRSSLLVRVLGLPALLIHGDPFVVDRWLWMKKRLPNPRGAASLLDVGSGNGVFTLYGARRGYQSVGLSWSDEDQVLTAQRCVHLRVDNAEFQTQDVRFLGDRTDLTEKFDVVLCFENIEHIIDDAKLLCAIAKVLRPNGTVLLTTPSEDYRPIDDTDKGPFLPIEDGRHVRKGYSPARLIELCNHAGLQVVTIGTLSGMLSQKLAGAMRALSRIHPLVGWAAILPFRALPPVLDPVIRRIGWPDYCLSLVAIKPARSANVDPSAMRRTARPNDLHPTFTETREA